MNGRPPRRLAGSAGFEIGSRAKEVSVEPPASAGRRIGGSRSLAVVAILSALAIPARAANTPPFVVASGSPSSRVTSVFKSTNGWVGGDAAYSTRLDDDRVLWTFGDSWIGKIRDGKRVDCRMINNSAALQSLGGNQQIDFIWRTRNGKPAALWPASESGTYYWPGDAAKVDGKLYVFLHVIKPKPQAPPPFQFEQAGGVMMRVDNPLDNPLRWNSKTAPIRTEKPDVNFGAACLADDDYLYSFCSHPPAGRGLERHPIIVARISRAQLAKMDMSAWEYWCHGSHHEQWQKELADPVVVIPDGAPEMSVSRVPGISGLLAIYMAPFSRKIFIRHAMKPEGPWSDRLLGYACPEQEKGILLYSAKAHPEQPASQCELTVTYCRNSQDFAWHISRPEIYFPQAVTIRLLLKHTAQTSRTARNSGSSPRRTAPPP